MKKPVCDCPDDRCRGGTLIRQGHPGSSFDSVDPELHPMIREYHKKRDELKNELYWLERDLYGKICRHNDKYKKYQNV